MTELFRDDTIVRRSTDALWRRLLDGVLILAPSMNEPLQISSPGDALWTVLADQITIADLVEHLARQYGASRAEILAGIEPVLATLLEAGALVVSQVGQPTELGTGPGTLAP